ncbi:uncharacterized protein LOC123656525 [Melitaea cinxia]|uniref:uncharacterized protein LOC123656525 n=1 Tax=Melitaea cinxia TaxID=113334 RepID=UPI001E2713B7|nr:uncharacterized protein LOC123656525 [Melitaea cinxia]
MYNKYNSRYSGRYNNPGRFVSPGELNVFPSYQQPPNQTFNEPIPEASHPPLEMKQQDDDMKTETMDVTTEDSSARPPWMKSKLQGVRKISNKERRRRQNETLRRLLTPKNALMVLNEIMPGEQVASQFKVEPVVNTGQFYQPNAHCFRADLTLHGQNYKGFGENKLMARNAAAEQAIRDLMLARMAGLLRPADPPGASGAEGENEETDEALPMIQLASYALHKLFTEWECEGHKVPQLRPPSSSISETASEAGSVAGGAAKSKVKSLPEAAARMHPCTLLTYMRPQLEYRELAASGAPPATLFTLAVDVDGRTYVGKAANKKEARKAAAKAACETIFNIQFEN